MPGELALRPDFDQDSEVRPEGGGAWRSVSEIAKDHPDLAATLDARARATAAWAKVEAARQELAALEGKPAPPPSPPPSFVPPPMFAEPEPIAEAPKAPVVEVTRPAPRRPPPSATPKILAAAALLTVLGLAGWFFTRRPATKPAQSSAPVQQAILGAPPETPPLADPSETPRRMVGILPTQIVEPPPVRAVAPRRKPRAAAPSAPAKPAEPLHMPGWKPAPVD